MTPGARTLPRLLAIGALAAAILAGCGPQSPDARLDRLAQRYVEQAMHLDRLRPGEVDLYFGPDRLDTRGEATDLALEALLVDIRELNADLAEARTERGLRLRERVGQLQTVVAFLAGEVTLTYPEQVRELYNTDWLEGDELATDVPRARLESNLPGRGSLRGRVSGLRQRMVVPAEQRQQVFERAFAECRKRTLVHWALPPGESVDLVFTREVRAARHRYDGDGRSTLTINPLAIATVNQALEIACHEGYPGHHAQLVLFEAAAGEEGLALEDTLVLLRSPVSAFREGAAMTGVDLVFPAAERLSFERDVLYPLAGLDPELAELHALIREDLDRQALAVPAIMRDHEDGQLSDAEAINRLQSEALVGSPRALFAFAHDVGAYLAGYTLVDAALAARLQTLSPAQAWLQLRRWLEAPTRWTEDSTQR